MGAGAQPKKLLIIGYISGRKGGPLLHRSAS